MNASLWREPAVRRLALFTLLGFTSFFLTLASLPAWAVDGGASRGAAGAVTTAMLAVTVATQFAVPGFVARVGMGPALSAGIVALAIPTPLFLVSHDLGWLAAVAAVRGVGFALLTVLAATIAATVAGEARRGEAIGIYGLAIALPSMGAVPAGAALVLSGHFAVVAWAGAATVIAVALVPGLTRVARTATLEPPEPAARRAAFIPTVVLFVTTLAGGGVVTLLPIERSDTAVVTIALLLFGATAALSRWGAGLVADRRGTDRVLPASLAAGAAGLAVLALGATVGEGTGGAVLVLAGGALFGVGFGAVQNLTLLAALARAGGGATTTVSSVWNAGFDLGTAVGALAVGAVASTALGLSGSFLVCAVAVAATTLLRR